MTQTLKQKIYENGIAEMQAGEFSGSLNVEEKNLNNGNFVGYTSLRNKQINLAYSLQVVESKGEERVTNVMTDVASHEINHHRYKPCIGCPQNVDKDTDLFFEPMYKILSNQDFLEEDVHYATNALQDSILHYDLKKNAGKNLHGIVEFFEDVGENCPNQKFTNFYEAHAKLNMFLWGEKSQRKKLGKFYANDAKVKNVLDGFFSELNDGKFKFKTNVYTRSRAEIKEKGILRKKLKRKWINREEREIEVFDRQGIRDYILDEDNWEKVSDIYAKHFSKLMEPNYAMSTPDHSGAGTKGREEEDSSNDGNPFKEERHSRNFKKGRIMKAGKSGEKAPFWVEQMEALNIYYEGLAEQLIINAETFSNSETFPIAWFGERDFNPERDSYRHIKFGFDDDGDLELKKKPYSIETQIRVKNSPRSFPQVKFGLTDISTSMQEDIFGRGNIGNTSIIPWGENSKYHWALMTQFGIFEYFRRNHLLTQNSISSAFFGENTEVVEGFQNVKEHSLNPRFERNTQIKMSEIRRFFEGVGNLIYTIGDGKIGNWSSIKKEFISNAKNHAYVHLHMGTENAMTGDLRRARLEVIVAQDGKGIVERVINLTDKIFRGQ